MRYKHVLFRFCCAVLLLSVLSICAAAVSTAPSQAGERRLEGGQRDLLWPVPGRYNVTSCFLDNRAHYALDIDGETNDPVVASYDGTVVITNTSCTHNYGKSYDCCKAWGNYVLLKHAYQLKNGQTVTMFSRYSHLTRVDVYVGQTVSAGQQIGTVGSTGYSTGSHLDYEILYGGEALSECYSIDPYINELLELPEGLYTTSGECCPGYVAYVKEFYTQCAHSQYDEHGNCTACGTAYNWAATRQCDVMGYYTVTESTTVEPKPYAENAGKALQAGEQVGVAAKVMNVRAEVWYEVVLSDGTQGYVSGQALSFQSFFDSEITGTLSTLKEGQVLPQASYRLEGNIVSAYPLRSIIGYLDGKQYASVSFDGSIMQTNLSVTALNRRLNFADLEPGEHTLVIKAADSTGREAVEIISCTFEISDEPVQNGSEDINEETSFVVVTYVIGSDTQVVVLEQGQPLGTLPQLESTQEDKEFVGWFTAGIDGVAVTEETVLNEDTTLYPRWSGNVCKVTFDQVEVEYFYGASIGQFPEVSKEGCRFVGWFLEDGTQVTEDTVVYEDMVICSQWEGLQYTLTLDPRGGTVSQNQFTVTYGEFYGELPVPTREGYHFVGWQLGSRAVSDKLRVSTAGDHTIVAVWQKEDSALVWMIPVAFLVVCAIGAGIAYWRYRQKEIEELYQ